MAYECCKNGFKHQRFFRNLQKLPETIFLDHFWISASERNKKIKSTTAWKESKYGVISVFRLNTEIYSVNLCIQSEYRKLRTRYNCVFGLFSWSGGHDISPNTLSIWPVWIILLLRAFPEYTISPKI